MSSCIWQQSSLTYLLLEKPKTEQYCIKQNISRSCSTICSCISFLKMATRTLTPTSIAPPQANMNRYHFLIDLRFYCALLICDRRKSSLFLPQGSKIESFSSNDMWCQLHLRWVCSIQGKENKKGRFWK